MMSNTSVIIPCYNGEEFLPNALKSLKEQTSLPQEIIVVDDGSTVPIEKAKKSGMSQSNKQFHFAQLAPIGNG